MQRSARLDGMNPQPIILIADDDPAIAQLAQFSLRDEGFEVVTAGNGSEALALEDEVSPDLILLDLEMPGLDGASVFRELRARRHNEPVLIISAHGARRAARTLGAQDALDKPFDPDELVERVRAALRDAASA